jgi:hypothetical protein
MRGTENLMQGRARTIAGNGKISRDADRALDERLQVKIA